LIIAQFSYTSTNINEIINEIMLIRHVFDYETKEFEKSVALPRETR